MAEYIEREAAIEAVKHAWAKGLEPSQYLEIIPAADVAPVRHGRWKTELDNLGWLTHTCTVCGYVKRTDVHVSLGWNYCPNCGAIMDNMEA